MGTSSMAKENEQQRGKVFTILPHSLSGPGLAVLAATFMVRVVVDESTAMGERHEEMEHLKQMWQFYVGISTNGFRGK
jgi:hypothetical protein